jgi:hypothetical protein
MGRLDEMAGIFLEDLGLEAAEAGGQEGEPMNYLPMRRGETGLAGRQDESLPRHRAPDRRLTASEREIQRIVQDTELIGEGLTYLLEGAIERSGDARVHTAMKLREDFKRYLLLKNLSYAESEELGQIMDATVKRMIHDQTNAALLKHNEVEELEAQLIEETYTRSLEAAQKRSVFDDFFRRR